MWWKTDNVNFDKISDHELWHWREDQSAFGHPWRGRLRKYTQSIVFIFLQSKLTWESAEEGSLQRCFTSPLLRLVLPAICVVEIQIPNKTFLKFKCFLGGRADDLSQAWNIGEARGRKSPVLASQVIKEKEMEKYQILNWWNIKRYFVEHWH